MLNRVIKILFVTVLINTSCTEKINESVKSNEEWSFVVFSDLQEGYGIFSQLTKIIVNLEPLPLDAFCCGDIQLRTGNEAEWVSFNHYAESIRQKMPLFIARGNHEGNDPASELMFHQYSGNTSKSFYFTYFEKETFFIVLDTYEKGMEGSIAGKQLEWLKFQLDSASLAQTVRNIFIIMHMPLYPQGQHLGQNLANAAELHQLFLDHKKIRAVFSGHDHMFNRYIKDGMEYITTGGGGGILYRGFGGDFHHFIKVSIFNDTTLINVKAIDIFNETIEDFTL